ncbi:hypothetical protein BLNAU_9996 [Blattamonas nauphoetae]|uniref:Uncharacterized protein n=1 Tax=Blattamonas nauphoetae TaxID=2049346 RepID=A0ABQ9XUB0_9EUKA|nr:hypothetical protein BLNAU_9996 [Blattamonas nauphoetae]
MLTVNSTSPPSGVEYLDGLTVTAAEKNPIERFDELLATYLNMFERSHPHIQESLVNLLRRFLNHTTKEERNDLLHRFGVAISLRDNQEIDIESLTKLVSSDEDILTLFHSSGLSHSILKQILPTQTINHQLFQLAKLSEICPLVSITTLSEDLSKLFRSFLCETTQYYVNDVEQFRSLILRIMDIMCNEVMAYAIIGCGGAVYETIISNFHFFFNMCTGNFFQPIVANSHVILFRHIIEISQNSTDPIVRISKFINILKNQTPPTGNDDKHHSMNLLSQCFQHTTKFLKRVALIIVTNRTGRCS